MVTRLRRETLSEQVATRILEHIRTHPLHPGTLLPSEARLGEEYGVSRQVVREALRSLQGRGVLTVLNGRGAMVRPLDGATLSFTFSRAIQIDTHSLVELMEVRLGLEVQCATLAAQRRTDQDVAELTRIAAAMRVHLYDELTYADLDLAFHLAIARAGGNAMLYHLVDSIREAARDAIQLGLHWDRSAERLEHMQSGHEAILRAVRQQTVTSAGRLMAQHLGGAVHYFAGIGQTPPAPAHGDPLAVATQQPVPASH
jgi:DNA-binding FadR family transcriptional regulator